MMQLQPQQRNFPGRDATTQALLEWDAREKSATFVCVLGHDGTVYRASYKVKDERAIEVIVACRGGDQGGADLDLTSGTTVKAAVRAESGGQQYDLGEFGMDAPDEPGRKAGQTKSVRVDAPAPWDKIVVTCWWLVREHRWRPQTVTLLGRASRLPSAAGAWLEAEAASRAVRNLARDLVQSRVLHAAAALHEAVACALPAAPGGTAPKAWHPTPDQAQAMTVWQRREAARLRDQADALRSVHDPQGRDADACWTGGDDHARVDAAEVEAQVKECIRRHGAIIGQALGPADDASSVVAFQPETGCIVLRVLPRAASLNLRSKFPEYARAVGGGDDE